MISAVRNEIKKQANAKDKASVLYFFKGELKLYGLTHPKIRKIANKFYSKEISDKQLIKYCEELFKSGYYEEGILAVEWLKKRKLIDIKLFHKWVHKYFNNWAWVDTLFWNLVSPNLKQHSKHIPFIKSWVNSKNMWVRRSACVAFVSQARMGNYHAHSFQIAKKLMKNNEKEDLVIKAYGWLLKEIANSDQKAVYDYIMKNKSNMPRTALRYAIEKFPKTLRKKAMA